MTLFLSQRDTSSKERMDDPHCDLAELENTYEQFNTINSLISQWRKIYETKVRPHLSSDTESTLLDIGFGGGDIPIKLANWAKNDGMKLHITAIDPDPRALNFIQKLDRSGDIEFLQCRLSELNPSGKKYDFVISNHLLHHLRKEKMKEMLTSAQKLSRQKVIFNDIERNDWAYLLFSLLSRPVFQSSFITEDGLTSIKRSYTREELKDAVPSDWHVESLFPFRLLLTYHHE